MKNLISIVLLFVFGVSWGQKSDSIAAENSVYWKISHPEAGTVSYLFGTIHMIDKDKFLLPEKVKIDLSQAEKLYLELDDLSNKSAAIKLARLENGRMTDILNKAERDSVYTFVYEEFKMDSAKFEKTFGKFKPFFFSQLATMKIMLASESYDQTFHNLATDSKIPIVALETMEEQVSFFDAMSDQMKVEMIMESLRNRATFAEDWENMQNAYLQQSIKTLLENETSSEEMNSYMETVMMQNRNEKWTSVLADELKQQNAFIAVGAAHLIGKFGLVNLLRENDFIVTPIDIKLTK